MVNQSNLSIKNEMTLRAITHYANFLCVHVFTFFTVITLVEKTRKPKFFSSIKNDTKTQKRENISVVCNRPKQTTRKSNKNDLNHDELFIFNGLEVDFL